MVLKLKSLIRLKEINELDLEVTKSKSYFYSQIACTFQNFQSEELHCKKWSAISFELETQNQTANIILLSVEGRCIICAMPTTISIVYQGLCYRHLNARKHPEQIFLPIQDYVYKFQFKKKFGWKCQISTMHYRVLDENGTVIWLFFLCANYEWM